MVLGGIILVNTTIKKVEMTDKLETVFNVPIHEKNQSLLLEQYKIYVESANLTSSLRSQANTYFLTINTILVSFLVGILEFSSQTNIYYWIVFACLAGVLLCISWFFLIRSYRTLNSGRFAVIHELEKALPARIYDREWEIIVTKTNPKKSKYIRQTYIEQIIPLAFGILYIALSVSYILTN